MGTFCNWPQKMQLQPVANLDVNPLAPPDSFLRLVIQQKTSVPFRLPLFLQPQTFGILEDATVLIFQCFVHHLWSPCN